MTPNMGPDWGRWNGLVCGQAFGNVAICQLPTVEVLPARANFRLMRHGRGEMTHQDVSLGQLAAQGVDIRFVCSDCGAGIVVPIERVLEKFGNDRPLADIQARAVCRHCNSIEVSVRAIARADFVDKGEASPAWAICGN